MTAPRTYAEWLPLLDRFKSGDNNSLAEMRAGIIEWTNVVAERWSRQVVDCLNERLRALSKEFQCALDRAVGDHLATGNAMLLVRRALEPLREFSVLPAVPDQLRTFMETQIANWTTQTQQSLERDAELVRHDQGRLLKTIRDHPLHVRPAAVAYTTPEAGRTAQEQMPAAKGRRILL